MVNLNFDIYENIIEILADDIRALKLCSLVCTAFCLLSRKHIFASVNMKIYHYHETSTSHSNFHVGHLLDTSPWIAKHVRTFDYNVQSKVKRKPRLPRRLRRVHTFRLIFCEESRHWDKDLSNNFKFSFKTFISSNSIVELVLHNISSLPVTILFYLPTLKVLDLQWVSLCDGPLPRFFGNPAHAPKLVEFRSVDSQIGPLHKFIKCDNSNSRPLLDMSNLEAIVLLVEVGNATMDFTITLMQAAQKLKTMTLTGYLSDLNLQGMLVSNLTKTSLQTLRNLAISPVLDYIYDDPYLHLITELDQMRGRNVLEEVSIYVQVQTDCRCTTELSRWAPLDSTFSPRSDFPFLKQVALRIVIYDLSGRSGELLAQLEEIGRTAFPWLTENKDFSFVFEVEVEFA